MARRVKKNQRGLLYTDHNELMVWFWCSKEAGIASVIHGSNGAPHLNARQLRDLGQWCIEAAERMEKHDD